MAILIAGHIDFAPKLAEALIKSAEPLIQAALDERADFFTAQS